MTSLINRPSRARSRSRRPATLALTALAIGALSLPLAGAESVREWSEQVWTVAQQGNAEALEQALDSVPDGANDAAVTRVRELAALRRQHIAEAAATRAAEREKSMQEMVTLAESGDVVKALTSAVAVQTLSTDWAKAVEQDEIASLVARGEALATNAEADGDWLLAQEVLYRLRTLFDDRTHFDRYERYNESLERVNRRIALLAQYAPHKLYELRVAQLKRADPDGEIPPFNQAGADDWREQLDGITQPMLMRSLVIAATEHIANGGWQPLLEGGIEALRILSTTKPLSENFPSLNDDERVSAWLKALDEQLASVRNANRQVDRGDYRDVIGNLIRANRQTVQLPEPVLLREFGDGAMYELAQRYEDQYTEIIWPERMRRFQQQTEGNFVGVGVLIRQDEKRDIVVVNPLEGSPAYRAGVKSEDRIVTVDGVSTLGWSLNRAVDTITGPRGKVVVLGLRRGESEDIIEVPIVRDTIKIRSVNGWWKTGLDQQGNPQWDWMIDPISRIGYVRLTSFNEDSFDDFMQAVQEMRADGPLNGLILDLRYNPGGLLKSAVQFSNLFVPRGEIVSGEDKDGNLAWRQEATPNRADAALVGLPVVVLINQGSASASEIVAGCLQAHGAAVIVGERTFGKGSVQTVHDASDRGEVAALKLTTQYYVLPARPGEGHGRLVHRKPGSTDWGVNPDITVEMTPNQIEAAVKLRQDADLIPEAGEPAGERADATTPRPNVNELLTKGVDPQLQTALLILQARALREANQGATAHRG